MNPYLKSISFKEPPNLEFVKRLTTPTGIIQHTTFAIPDRFEGYAIDDNARALVLTIMDHKLFGKHQSINLATTYLAYLTHSRTPDNWFYTYQTFDHHFKKERSEDAYGRVMWALGYTVWADVRWDITSQALKLFNQVRENLHKLDHSRSVAYSLLGCLYLQQSIHRSDEVEEVTQELTQRLVDLYEKYASVDWPWFESFMTYSNALLPLALFKSYQYFKKDQILRIAVESFGFLESQSRVNGKPAPIGNKGWLLKGEKRAIWDQQPIDSALMVMANAEAYRVLKGENYLASAMDWFSWFHGNNLKEAVMFDPHTQGSFDGLNEDGPNKNEGAESTLIYWLAYLDLVDILKNQS